MPLRRGLRPLKRWRWVGVFGPELMLCVAAARVGPLAQRWWALAEPDGRLRQRTGAPVRLDGSRVAVEDGDARIELALEESDGVEVVSPSGDGWIWTRKQAGVPVRGSVRARDREWSVEGEAFVDDSAGYHERRTAWRWSAGLGREQSGQRVAWNLVTGVHDAPEASERTVWIGGEPHEVGPVAFADDLSRVDGLEFREWCSHERHTNRLVFRSDYRQSFGTFSGELPLGVRLAEGYGVMEEHGALW
jgi:hypothetical protein